MAQQRIIKRIGNDVYVNIPIYEQDGTPFSQGGAQCRFEMRNEYTEPIPVRSWTISGNRLSFWILSKEIIATGYYDLWGEIKRNESSVRDGKATHTFDVRRVMKIVKHSESIDDHESSIGMHAMLDMYALSAYHSYVRTTEDDPILTEKEWIALLPFGGSGGETFRKMHIEQELESMMPGEAQRINIFIYDGFGRDVTNQYGKLDVERDSGDQYSDAVWNYQNGINKGFAFELTFQDLNFQNGRRGARFECIATAINHEKIKSNFSIG